MAWLALAIGFEIAGTTSVKMSHGFTQLVPSLAIFPLYGISFVFLTLAVKVIPISLAYAVWSGVGTALIATIGILWFREPVTALKLIFIALIVVGVVGLYLTDEMSGAS